jgi:hypothetical protein
MFKFLAGRVRDSPFAAKLAFGGTVAGEPYHGVDGEGSNQIVLRDKRFA